MKIKHLIACAAVAFSALTASAQEGLRFGVTAGMNVSNITDLKQDCKLGFNAGVRGEYNFNKNLYMNAGLIWSMQGTYKKVENEFGSVTYKTNPSYLQIPIHVGGRICLGDGVSVFGETGPYFAVGVCGKNKISSDTVLGEGEGDSDYFGDNGAKRFDAGWGIRAGVEVSNIQIHLGYDHGFVKVYDTDNIKPYNWNFSVGLSYMF